MWILKLNKLIRKIEERNLSQKEINRKRLREMGEI